MFALINLNHLMILNCNVFSSCVDYCNSKHHFLTVLLGIIFTQNKSKIFTLYPVSENFMLIHFLNWCVTLKPENMAMNKV